MLNSNKNLSVHLLDNLKELNTNFIDCPDIIQKKVMLKEMKKGCFIFIKNFINVDLLQRDFIRPLLSMDFSILSDKKITAYLPALNTSLCYDVNTAVKAVLEGNTVFLIDGVNFAVVGDMVDLEKRVITEPDGEKNVRGPHDGFIESLNTNITLLRRKIKNNNLKFKQLVLGNITNQNLVIAYMEGIANPDLINILYTKISDIKTDGLLSIGHIEQLITDSKYSPFPQYMATERPDRAVAALLEGKLAVLLDGTPYVLIAPVSIFSFFQAPDDYISNWLAGTIMRLIRMAGVIITLTFPALYISVTSFQYYLVPLNILVQLGQSRARVAFPPIVEAILMELTIEMLREASIRLPTYIASTIGVVGGIIIGQAAVNAGIVSNLFVIVVGITTIASYVTPNNDFGLATVIVRLGILLMASVFGMIGVVVSLMFLLMHLLSLESLGQPYLMPIMPLRLSDLKDSIVRVPLQFMKKRPHTAQPIHDKRDDKK